MSTRIRRRHERGAAAVEMAILLPLLVLVLGGIIDFGRALYTQNIATNAAREGARMRALGYTTTQADARVASAMVGYSAASYTVGYETITAGGPVVGGCPTSPTVTDRARVVVTIASFDWIFPLPLTPPVLSAQAELRCGG